MDTTLGDYMIDIKALEKALATIGNVGKGELSIDVGGTPVTLRVLTADEDMDAQRYSRTPPEGLEEVEGLTLLERYKRTVLAYAIIQIGGINLRDEAYIATGEVTDKGVPVRKARHLVVREIIDGWSRVTTMALFQKYLELQRRVDAEAERAIHFDVTDLDTEIARVEKRLADLRKERERTDMFQNTGATASAVAAVGSRLQAQARNMEAAAAGESIVEPISDVIEPEPVIMVAPPRSEPPPMPSATPVQRQRVGPPQGAPPIPPPRHVPAPVVAPNSFDEMRDSMEDGPDQIANETARLVAARQASRRQSLDAAAESPTMIETPILRTPPHREAANTTDAVLDEGVGSFRAARVSGPQEGMETHRLDPVVLSERGRQSPPMNQRVQVNAGPKTGPTNPRFRNK